VSLGRALTKYGLKEFDTTWLVIIHSPPIFFKKLKKMRDK